MPRISQARGDLGPDRERRLVEPTASPDCVRELVQRGREAAAGRVAHPAQRLAELEQRGGELVDRRGVALDVGLELRGRRGRPSPPCRGRRACPRRARGRPAAPAPAPRSTPCVDDADAGGRDEEAVGLARARRPSCRRRRPRRRPPRGGAPSRRRSGAGRRPGSPPRSRTPAESQSGRAPATARSLTVPLTASSPMSPPGKKSGLTT